MFLCFYVIVRIQSLDEKKVRGRDATLLYRICLDSNSMKTIISVAYTTRRTRRDVRDFNAVARTPCLNGKRAARAILLVFISFVA